MTGGLSGKHGTHKSPPARKSLLESILIEHCMNRQEGPRLARNNPETAPITIKAGTVSPVAEHFSWVALPCYSLPGCPFSITFSYFISTCVSLGSSLLSDRQEPTVRPWKGSPLPATELERCTELHFMELHPAKCSSCEEAEKITSAKNFHLLTKGNVS